MPAYDEFFRTVKVLDDGVHRYRIIEPNHADWLRGLADLYRELRTATRVPLSEIDLSGLDFDTKDLSIALVETQLPKRFSGHPKVKTMAVERSDIGELVMALVGEVDHGYGYGYRSVRDRELVTLPGRGIDQIGVRELIDEVTSDRSYVLSLGEAKVSADKKSPPGVVDAGKDCLRDQHLFHLSETELTRAKVISAARQTSDIDLARHLHIAAMLLKNGSDKLTIRSTSMLVRNSSHQEADFGSFRSAADDYQPGHIDFTILVLDVEDIELLVDEFLSLARQEAA